MKNALQQGNADGLCGLYSILNFLMTLDDWREEGANKGLEHVLEAAQAEGVLGPSWIAGVYRDGEIKAILNKIFERWWLSYKAIFLCEIDKSRRETNYDLYRRILNVGGSVIGGPKGRDHWVFITQPSSGAVIIDSNDSDQPVITFDDSMKSYCSADAVVILPFARGATHVISPPTDLLA